MTAGGAEAPPEASSVLPASYARSVSAEPYREPCPRCGAPLEWRHQTLQCPRCRFKAGCCEGQTGECVSAAPAYASERR